MNSASLSYSFCVKDVRTLIDIMYDTAPNPDPPPPSNPSNKVSAMGFCHRLLFLPCISAAQSAFMLKQNRCYSAASSSFFSLKLWWDLQQIESRINILIEAHSNFLNAFYIGSIGWHNTPLQAASSYLELPSSWHHLLFTNLNVNPGLNGLLDRLVDRSCLDGFDGEDVFQCPGVGM